MSCGRICVVMTILPVKISITVSSGSFHGYDFCLMCIPSQTPSIIAQCGIQPDKWIDHVKNFGRRYSICAGSPDSMLEYAELFNRRWARGVAVSGGLMIAVDEKRHR